MWQFETISFIIVMTQDTCRELQISKIKLMSNQQAKFAVEI